MSWLRSGVFAVLMAMGAGAWVGEARAQPPAWTLDEAHENGWTLGLSAGSVWGPNDMADKALRSGGFDISIQRQVEGMWRRRDGRDGDGNGAIRLQIGRGSGYDSGQRRFDYRRVMLGAFREFSIIPSARPPAYLHLGAGIGAYRVSSAGERRTTRDLFVEAGFEVRLGPGRLTLGPEFQIHTLGNHGLYSTTSLVARIRLP